MSPRNDDRPADSGRSGSEAAATGSANPKSKPTLQTIADNFGDVARDALVEALLAGEAATWERAAERFDRARPRPDEFHGARSRQELRVKWLELTELANACRARARVLRPRDGIETEVQTVLEDLHPGRDTSDEAVA